MTDHKPVVRYLERVSISSRVVANFQLKFTNFRYYGNKGRSGGGLNDIQIADPKRSVWCKKSGTHLKYKLIYSKFCVKISKFLLPRQQGLVG